MTQYDDIQILLNNENTTLNDLRDLIANLRTYGVIQFAKGISEFAGTGTHLIPVRLSLCGGPLSAAVTVSISAAGTGSPAYTLNTTSLTFPANSVDGATQNVSVTVTQADAGDKLTLNMGVAGPATVGARGVHTVDFVGLEWCQTFDFALDDGGLIGIYGGWSNGAWRSANLTPHERVAMRIAFPSTQLNTIRIKYTCSRPSGGGSRRIDWDWSETSGTVFQAYGTLSANSGSFDTTFTKTVTTTKLRVLIDTASDMTGENTITYLQVCGMGANPFI